MCACSQVLAVFSFNSPRKLMLVRLSPRHRRRDWVGVTCLGLCTLRGEARIGSQIWPHAVITARFLLVTSTKFREVPGYYPLCANQKPAWKWEQRRRHAAPFTFQAPTLFSLSLSLSETRNGLHLAFCSAYITALHAGKRATHIPRLGVLTGSTSPHKSSCCIIFSRNLTGGSP